MGFPSPCLHVNVERPTFVPQACSVISQCSNLQSSKSSRQVGLKAGPLVPQLLPSVSDPLKLQRDLSHKDNPLLGEKKKKNLSKICKPTVLSFKCALGVPVIIIEEAEGASLEILKIGHFPKE